MVPQNWLILRRHFLSQKNERIERIFVRQRSSKIFKSKYLEFFYVYVELKLRFLVHLTLEYAPEKIIIISNATPKSSSHKSMRFEWWIAKVRSL